MSSSNSMTGSQQGTTHSHHRSRHCHDTIAKLEEMFKECPRPDENRRRQISVELGINLDQVKFWFQNKKTQMKARNDRLDNNALRWENERIQAENLRLRATLHNLLCVECGGPPVGVQERELYLQNLRVENILLNQEYESVRTLLANSGINPMLLHDTSRENLLNQTVGSIPVSNQLILPKDNHIYAQNQLMTPCELHIPARNQHTPLNQLIPTNNPLIPTYEQQIPTMSSLDQHIHPLITHGQSNYNPVVEQVQAPNHNNDICIPPLAPILDDLPSFDPDLDAVLDDILLNCNMEDVINATHM